MNLLELAAKIKEEPKNQSILLYGDSGSGKTRMAATVATVPWINKVVWIDLENGLDTVLHMDLPDSALRKIEPYCMGDTRADPYVLNTMQKMYSSKEPVILCEKHSRLNCLDCNRNKGSTKKFSMTAMTNRDVIVIDTGSQFYDCIINFLLKGQPDDAILQVQEHGAALNFLKGILQPIQNAKYCHTIVTAHTYFEHTYQGKPPNRELVKVEEFPMMGTNPFSHKVAGYFGTVINLRLSGGKHVGGSSTTYRPRVQTRSRMNIKLEAQKEIHMKYFFPDLDKEV